MVRSDSFNRDVTLPDGLTVTAIRKAIEYVEREVADLIDLYFEQANLFSGLVGLFAIRALESNSLFERHRHVDVAQTRFPDLKRRGSGRDPTPQQSLECKASKRPWELQSHYNHSGWYIVWRYLVDRTCSLEPNRPVIIWRVDVVFLTEADWKYEGSKAAQGRGGRTHTFGVRNAASKLRGKSAYQRTDVFVTGGKAVPRNGNE